MKTRIYDFLFEQESKVDSSAENAVNLKDTKTKARKNLKSVDQQIDALILKYEAASLVDEDPDNLLKEGEEGISVALLEKGHPGLQQATYHNPLNVGFQIGRAHV